MQGPDGRFRKYPKLQNQTATLGQKERPHHKQRPPLSLVDPRAIHPIDTKRLDLSREDERGFPATDKTQVHRWGNQHNRTKHKW